MDIPWSWAWGSYHNRHPTPQYQIVSNKFPNKSNMVPSQRELIIAPTQRSSYK